MMFSADHVEITMLGATSRAEGSVDHRKVSGVEMTAIIYKFDRSGESSSIDETERLFSALERYTSAELLELLYVGEEPGFFELIRGLFGLSDESRSVLQDFLTALPLSTTKVEIDPDGRCVLAREVSNKTR
jgi:hypothetical protein